MFPKNTRIGIWGFSKVGQSIAHILYKLNYSLFVMDSNNNISTHTFLHNNAIPFFSEKDHDIFFTACDIVIPSPGIDIRSCATHKHTFFTELDLFSLFWKKPIIAITGTVGKTTITSMIEQLCNYNYISIITGGNIGTAACTLLKSKKKRALLETSSFQLEHCTHFAPHIAVITNVYPNHLDRHDSLKAYWRAKATIFCNQTEQDHLIAPIELHDHIKASNPKATIWYTSTSLSHQTNRAFTKNENYISLVDTKIIVNIGEHYQTYKMPKTLFLQTFSSNALIVWTVLYLLTYNQLQTLSFDCNYIPQEHRLEHVATHNGITFINDSKATTMASTLAAIKQYKDKPIILLLGGLSKGAHRKELIKQLPPSIVYIACFGQEACELDLWCKEYSFISDTFKTLSDALYHACTKASSETILLFSPSGSSFDLYSNYKERGLAFKQLVNDYINQSR